MKLLILTKAITQINKMMKHKTPRGLLVSKIKKKNQLLNINNFQALTNEVAHLEALACPTTEPAEVSPSCTYLVNPLEILFSIVGISV
jgi:hypothetical protein